MQRWKRNLLRAYYYGSLPYRYEANAWAARRGRAPVMVLFYHRVADDRPNGWTISNRLFEQQISWIRDRFDLVSLEEAQQRIRSSKNHRPAVSITFDDGYADNCDHALPLLIKHRIPCTYFVATRHIFDGVPFPHDIAIGSPLRPNTLDQLKALASSGVEIGAHTRTHANLGRIQNPQVLYEEVVEAGEELQTLLECPVRYFAFPFGLHENLRAEVFHMAYQAGYEGVCSAYGGYNFPGDDAYHLQRIHADPEMLRLKNWLTVDPRKKRCVRRFEYELSRQEHSSLGATIS